MMARDRATARDAGQRTERTDQRPVRDGTTSAGDMAVQSSRGFEAAPQAFVRLTGSHLAKSRVSRQRVTE
ncbi:MULTISPECIES: hypothetical protein [unclassified Bradyrhizobium]|uniref:hypothetical protein n=1 Tax=unclassified Bradyrhizobium TaxID=2631580 RepID=UPI001FF7AF1E|nr:MULTISPECIES: hypothetical protein [unclassified Bradyrhizobium]MCK1712047.1 hypothetical protein [Bradyrhizobium sp. 143]MCK1726313.1 hypothetical protein [Bradyrhizobium sp. 142]